MFHFLFLLSLHRGALVQLMTVDKIVCSFPLSFAGL